MNCKFLERHTEKPLSLAATRKRENPVNTALKMVSKSSTKQVEEATTEEAPGSIVICTEEVNTFNRDVKRSVLSLGHFISFSFATKEVKGLNYFPPRANGL